MAWPYALHGYSYVFKQPAPCADMLDYIDGAPSPYLLEHTEMDGLE